MKDFRIAGLTDPNVAEEFCCLVSAMECRTWTMTEGAFAQCVGASDTCDRLGFRFPYGGTSSFYCASPLVTCANRRAGWKPSPSVSTRVLETDDILGFRASTLEALGFVQCLLASAIHAEDELLSAAAKAWAFEDWRPVDMLKPKRLSRVRNRVRAKRILFDHIARKTDERMASKRSVL